MEKQNNNKAQVPRCDIYKDEGKFFVRLEVPGVDKDELDIHVENNRLIIDGVKKQSCPEGSHYQVREIVEYDYRKELSIDDTIDREKIEADLSDGILTLSIGLKEAAKPHKIAINVNQEV